MDDKDKEITLSKTFNSTTSNSIANEECEIDDPISAYFKKRCSNSHKTYFQKYHESDSDSSLGVIDVDNMSLFEEESENLRLSGDSLENLKRKSLSSNEIKKYHSVSNTLKSDTESHLEKQRALAQKVLLKFNNKTNETQNDLTLTSEKSEESNALNDISSKLMNTKLSVGKNVNENWFQPNFSPNTPRYFNDELSSFGSKDSLSAKNELQTKFHQNRESEYIKKVNSMVKQTSQLNLSSDLEFESCGKEEQIHKFIEDEKKFILENSGVLHNSEISQFSGVVEEDITFWPSDLSNTLKPEIGSKNLSIGEFFNLRSNRVSSLMGSVKDEKSVQHYEQESDKSALDKTKVKNIFRNESLPLCDSINTENLKIRRCFSTFDLKEISEVTKNHRFSNDSCSSNSTVLIQNLLAEMESGLSGTEIYEKLIKSYGRNKIFDKESNKKSPKFFENNETPKSSKVFKRKDLTKINSKEQTKHDLNKGITKKNLKTTPTTDVECKENNPLVDLKENLNTSLKKCEKIKKLKCKKGFDASTPKLQVSKAQKDKFKTNCNKVLMSTEDWEAPRVSSIQPTIDLNKSESSDDYDKTIMGNLTNALSEPIKKNSTIVLDDTLTIEDTIKAGDLSVLSQRIEEMKSDGVCIVRSEENDEPILLKVVQKLADFPKGSIACSALTPLLRDQFPELLSTFPTSSKELLLSTSCFNSNIEKPSDLLVLEPDSWVKLPVMMGVSEKIYGCVEVEQTIFIPITNISQNWLLISIKSLKLIHSNGQRIYGTKKNNEWTVFDFVVVSMKETLVPPNTHLSLQIFFTPKLPTKIDLKLTFALKHLLKEDVQSRSLQIRTNNINPLNYINVIPKDSINFGILADQCFDYRMVQVSFDGLCKLPLVVYIEENDSHTQHFNLKPCITSSGNPNEVEWNVSKFNHVFHEGEKQLLEFQVLFQPNTLLNEGKAVQDFKALLIFKIGAKTDSDGILQKILIKGSVGFAKFLCNPSCSPLVFRAAEKGQSITRSFPLKNVGSLPIAFYVKIISEDTKAEQEDSLFVVPKSFYLSKNEESAINITFNANTLENCTKRLLILQMKPNGRATYEVELIGIISSEIRPLSRTSGSTKSLVNSDSVPIKLLTTAQSLSWPAVALEKEVRLSLQLKNVSAVAASVRLSFRKNVDSFKLVNENGERVQKIRKVLKTDCPYTVTVAFRPDLVGAHHNAIIIEMNHPGRKKMISLSGIGGLPNLYIGNVKSDLNGCKIVKLQNSSNTQFFSNILQFKNEGRVPGFILIKPSVEVFSLSHELMISPSCCVLAPNSKVNVKLSQKLKSDNLKLLLMGKDISKIATLSVIMGDEPSRLRLRKLMEKGVLGTSERLNILTAKYNDEKEIDLEIYEDSLAFENQFLKSLKVIEIVVAVERSSGSLEPTILEDADETVDEFVTIISNADDTVISKKPSANENEIKSRLNQQKAVTSHFDSTIFSLDNVSSHNRITKWLETLEC